MTEQKCRICGCTENDCSQCIKLTGHPCHWVEDDLCSACKDAIDNQNKITDMNFFEELSTMADVDMTIRIMKKNNQLTLNIMPGSGSSTQKPLLFTGTGQELDEEFFKTIMPGVQEVKGLVTNLEDVKKAAAADTDKNKSAASKEKPAAKNKAELKTSKKPAKPQPKEANLFEMDKEEEENEEQVAAESEAITQD